MPQDFLVSKKIVIVAKEKSKFETDSTYLTKSVILL